MPFVQRLSYTESLNVPNVFRSTDRPASTGTALLLTREPAFQGPVLAQVEKHLGGSEVLEFQLRHRGAAIIKVRARQRRYVIRLVPHSNLQAVVERNHSKLRVFRKLLSAESDLQGLMPEPVFAANLPNALLLGETHLQGVLAWKLAAGPLGPAIYANAISYLRQLRRATSTTGPIGREGVEALLRDEEEQVAAATFVSNTVRSGIRRELRGAAEILAGADIVTHASHGDFGFGNILVEPTTGQLSGIIDWDTARPTDFPGIDRVNLEIQIRRGGDSNQSLFDATRSVWRERTGREALDGPEGPSGARALFGLAVCRLVTRSFSYPSLYRQEAEQFEQVLGWLRETGAEARG